MNLDSYKKVILMEDLGKYEEILGEIYEKMFNRSHLSFCDKIDFYLA